MGELKERITYTEFLDWLEYLSWLENRQTKHDHYLAQIAAEVRRGQVKHPRMVKVKHFLLRQVTVQQAARTRQSKMAWAAALGVNMEKN